MFIQRAQVYWITWALIILGAWSTGIASVSDAFFRGAFAAFLSAAALPLYRQLGPRKAAFLGLVVGITWQLGFHHLWGRMIWGEAEFALASARLVLDLSVAAAAFAGGALAGGFGGFGLALVHLADGFVQRLQAGVQAVEEGREQGAQRVLGGVAGVHVV